MARSHGRAPPRDPGTPSGPSTGPRRWVRRAGGLVVLVALVEYVVVPQLVEARNETETFTEAAAWPVVLALGLEVCSVTAYTLLTLAVLDRSVRPPFGVQLRIDVTGLGASHVLPGGGASAVAVRYRLMTAAAVPSSDVLSTAAVQYATGVVGLVATFTVGVVLASPGIWAHPLYAVAGLAGVALLATTLLVTPRPRLTGRRWWPRLRARPWLERAGTAVGRVVDRAAVPLRDRHRRRVLLGWAVSASCLDAASLWLSLWAFGTAVPPGVLLVAYSVANLAALLPLTPGGLGVVEGVLVPTLTLLGGAGGAVVLGVLTWRALQFWLPIPVSGLTYLSLRPWRHAPADGPADGPADLSRAPSGDGDAAR